MWQGEAWPDGVHKWRAEIWVVWDRVDELGNWWGWIAN